MRSALFLVLVAACYDPSPPAGGPCIDRCPTGQTCRAGFCVATDDQLDDAALDGAVSTSIEWLGSATGSIDNQPATLVSTPGLVGDPDDVYIAVVSVKPTRAVNGLTGLGLSWNLVRDQCGGRNTARLAMFWARSFGLTAGVVTASLGNGGPATVSAVISVHRYRGVDPTTPIGNASWANTNGQDGTLACSGGADTQTYSWSTLDTTANGSLVIAGVHTANYTHAPGGGYIEREDLQSGATSSSAGVAVEERSFAGAASEIRVNGSFSNSPDWAAIAVELRATGD